jgi:membrane-associated phospholipid phosphatase
MSIVGNIKQDQYLLISIWLLFFYAFEKSRKFILGFSIFIIFWIIYDSMRIMPNYEVSTAHIKEPYEFEKALFGIKVMGNTITANEFFDIWNNKFLDFMSGFFYINWMPIPLAFGIYLFIKDKYLFAQFSIAFLLVNLVGFTIYYIYPAAPPWYVKLYGFDLHIGVPGNRAGLARFDDLINYPLFAGIYNKNANVLAAMPSLHATYPLIVLYFGIKKRLTWVNIIFVIFTLGIWFSAVYSGHHYIIDVVVGVVVALVVLFSFEKIITIKYIDKLIKKFAKNI